VSTNDRKRTTAPSAGTSRTTDVLSKIPTQCPFVSAYAGPLGSPTSSRNAVHEVPKPWS
jgi:hypothetical protein